MIELALSYGGRLLEGAAVTVELVVLSSALGFLVAVPVAVARLSWNPLLSGPAFAYTYVLRGTPLLVQLFLVYYGLGQFEAVRESLLWTVLREAWWCGLIALTLNTSAYVAEILRGGMKGVPQGEVEAADALGLSRLQVLRLVLLPRALRLAWPAYGNEIVLLLKGSALVSTITVMDLMGVARTVFSRTYDLGTFVLAAAIYFLLALAVSRGWSLAERHLNRHTMEAAQPQRPGPPPAIG